MKSLIQIQTLTFFTDVCKFVLESFSQKNWQDVKIEDSVEYDVHELS